MPGEPGEALAARSGKGGPGDGPLRPFARHLERVILSRDKPTPKAIVAAESRTQ